jgi:hypothetical protein
VLLEQLEDRLLREAVSGMPLVPDPEIDDDESLDAAVLADAFSAIPSIALSSTPFDVFLNPSAFGEDVSPVRHRPVPKPCPGAGMGECTAYKMAYYGWDLHKHKTPWPW